MSWYFWAGLSLALVALAAVGLVLTETVHSRPYKGADGMRQCPHCRRHTYVENSTLREHFISPGIACPGELRRARSRTRSKR
jgi:hypothetical protein